MNILIAPLKLRCINIKTVINILGHNAELIFVIGKINIQIFCYFISRHSVCFENQNEGNCKGYNYIINHQLFFLITHVNAKPISVIHNRLKKECACGVLFQIVQIFNALLQMSFTDKLLHLQFIPTLDKFFTFICSSVYYYTITQMIDIGPSWTSRNLNPPQKMKLILK